jgi:hypothetical protein
VNIEKDITRARGGEGIIHARVYAGKDGLSYYTEVIALGDSFDRLVLYSRNKMISFDSILREPILRFHN